MAFDATLGDRLRGLLKGRRGISEKKMFGGLFFFHRGNMLVGVWKLSLLVRLGAEGAEDSKLMAHVRPFQLKRKLIKNWLLVDPDGIGQEGDLAMWVEHAFDFVKTLKPK